jgi:hypothetical protein
MLKQYWYLFLCYVLIPTCRSGKLQILETYTSSQVVQSFVQEAIMWKPDSCKHVATTDFKDDISAKCFFLSKNSNYFYDYFLLDLKSCILVGMYQRFVGTCPRNVVNLSKLALQKIIFFAIITARNSHVTDYSKNVSYTLTLKTDPMESQHFSIFS